MDHSTLYLVNDGDRAVALAAEHDGKLYSYVPNIDAFVYNKPMSIDFLIDQNMTYEPQAPKQAGEIIKAGVIGKIDSTNTYLLDHMKAETDRLTPAEVLGMTPQPPTRSTRLARKALPMSETPDWFNEITRRVEEFAEEQREWYAEGLHESADEFFADRSEWLAEPNSVQVITTPRRALRRRDTSRRLLRGPRNGRSHRRAAPSQNLRPPCPPRNRNHLTRCERPRR